VAIPSVILPSQIARILGPGAPHLTLVTGCIVAGGAAVALVVAPLAGALSDRAAGERGRRRPFLISGTLASCIGLGALALAAESGSIVLYALAYGHLQFWWNWAAGPYAGLIPDAVPPDEQSRASGWMNAMSILGVIAGNLLVAAAYAPSRPGPVTGIFIALTLFCLIATLAGVREKPASGLGRFGGPYAFLRSFYLDPRVHGAFYLVLATRLISNMGVWSVLAFLLFYFEAVLGLGAAEAARVLPAVLGAGALLSIPASLAGARLADRHGVVGVVQAASWIMALATVAYVAISFRPSLALAVPAVLAFSVANGAYGAADWYLAIRVLPRMEHAAKDFGIWHVCMVLPQIIGP
jgi:Na+/melibiose symporter-like transporter